MAATKDWCPRCGRRLRDAACVDCPPVSGGRARPRSDEDELRELRGMSDGVIAAMSMALDEYREYLPEDDVDEIARALDLLEETRPTNELDSIREAFTRLIASSRGLAEIMRRRGADDDGAEG